ncbi:MAG: insulinase family protein [Acidobacteria bacterium]|nr:MAG: insulinase family protein [Acidobacteriota bacterium]
MAGRAPGRPTPGGRAAGGPMIKIVLAVLCVLGVAGAGVALAGDPAGKVFPYPVRVETLDNGLQLILIPMPSEGLVAYWSIVRTGSRDEYEPGHTGFAHFFEHMMFRGTERHPADEYNRLITRMGADANAYTTDDLTAYHLGIAKEDLETVMELEADRFQHLSYDESAFKTEAGAVYGEYRKSKMSPFFSIYEAVRETAFDRHTYGHTTMGFVEDIKAMPTMYDYSRRFFERYYRPDNVVLLIAGDIEPDRVVELARRYYGDWKPGYVPPEIPPEPEQTRERRIDVPYQGRSLPIIWIAYKNDRFRPDDRNWVASDLLASLAFGETSDLHKELVLDKQWVEFIEAEVNVNRDPGLIDIISRVKDPEKVDAVLERIDSTIARFQKELVSEKRLADLKSRLRYRFLMGLDTPDHVAASLARIVAVTGGIEAVETYYTTLEQVTREDVRQAALRLTPQRRTVAVLRGKSE